MSRRKSQKNILEHYECENQLDITDFGIGDSIDTFLNSNDPQDYFDMTHFEPEDLYDYNPCAECYPRTVEGCSSCYLHNGNGGD